uniref:ATP synthase F0 subunit 8 n=1 Tax=Renouxia sp. TaxID=2485823 RepID=A0A3G3MIH2_9FLOR|nr:ATP synthase F0 subunit 8 [Renouxia sp.]
MPQLDYTIVFPQIFWLMLMFTVTYSGLLHFFLPIFLKVLKSRKLVVLFNVNETLKNEKRLLEKQNYLNETLNKNLIVLKNVFMKDILTSLSSECKIDIQLVDVKLAKALRNNMLYCNNQLLDCIVLEPRLLNFKFKK